MRKPGFSLGLIIVSNILIIGISLVYGLHVFPVQQNEKNLNLDTTTDDFRDLTIQSQNS